MSKSIRFFAIADFGNPNAALKSVAKAMDVYARESPPDFILGLGDNFYPTGVMSSKDPQFQTAWRNVFLRYPSLRVPWRMVLGNHDYMGNPDAQKDFHYDTEVNHDGLWHMPDFNYSFGMEIPSAEAERMVSVDFFALDSNACQDHVRYAFPDLIPRLHADVANLKVQLSESAADWKILFAHHPIYTQGRGHGKPAKCLREAEYEYQPYYEDEVTWRQGFGLEKILIEGGVDAYFAGHEHVFQCHHMHGIHHFGCGASGADIRRGSGLYDGVDQTVQLDWVGKADQVGFVSAELSADQMVVSFIGVDAKPMKQITVTRRTSVGKTNPVSPVACPAGEEAVEPLPAAVVKKSGGITGWFKKFI